MARGEHPIHSELGRENPQRRWYFVLRRGRVGRCQAKEVSLFSFMKVSFLPKSEHKFRAADINAGWSSPVARQAHNLKVAGSNPAPATNTTHLKNNGIKLAPHLAAPKYLNSNMFYGKFW